MAEEKQELSRREQRRADRRVTRHERKQARIDRVQRRAERTGDPTGHLGERVQRIQNRKDKIGEGADRFRESWQRRRSEVTGMETDPDAFKSNTSGAKPNGDTTPPPPPTEVPEGVPTEGAGLYGHEKATTSMGKLALGSDERKAEYDRRGWAYDDTIAGDHKGAYKAKKDNIYTTAGAARDQHNKEVTARLENRFRKAAGL